MGRFLAVVLLGGVAAVTQVSYAGARASQTADTMEQSQGTQPLATPATSPGSGSQSTVGASTPSNVERKSGTPESEATETSEQPHSSRVLPKLPPAPRGTKTVMGGAIRNVDPVRDQLMLNVYGGSPVKILFDERTKVFRNGEKISLLRLGPEDHASVETVLDGVNIFALSIHILSSAPEGESQGQVQKYDARKGKLTLQAVIAKEPLILRVPPGTPVTREGQAAAAQGAKGATLADLVRGTMVKVKFESDDHGGGVVNHIAILAQPGSSFIFTGNISFFDIHADRLDIVDPRDNQTYDIFFEPGLFPVSKKFHTGMALKVTATFDGSRYTATSIDEK